MGNDLVYTRISPGNDNGTGKRDSVHLASVGLLLWSIWYFAAMASIYFNEEIGKINFISLYTSYISHRNPCS